LNQIGVSRSFSRKSVHCDDDVQVLHGFDTAAQANAYLKTGLFTSDVGGALKPLLDAEPDVRIYQAA